MLNVPVWLGLKYHHSAGLFHFHGRNVLLFIRFLGGLVLWFGGVLGIWCRTGLCGCHCVCLMGICSKWGISKLGFSWELHKFVCLHANKCDKNKKNTLRFFFLSVNITLKKGFASLLELITWSTLVFNIRRWRLGHLGRLLGFGDLRESGCVRSGLSRGVQEITIRTPEG